MSRTVISSEMGITHPSKLDEAIDSTSLLNCFFDIELDFIARGDYNILNRITADL